MTRHYAIEITLTRPASCREMRRARKHVALAENADRTRLMTLQSARPGHCPAPDAAHTRRGTVHRHRRHPLPRPQRPPSAQRDPRPHPTKAVRKAAAANGQHSSDFLGQRLAQEVERSEQERQRRLTVRLESLLQQHTREEVLSCAASLLNRRHPSAAAP